jgi:hypothetical protein
MAVSSPASNALRISMIFLSPFMVFSPSMVGNGRWLADLGWLAWTAILGPQVED